VLAAVPFLDRSAQDRALTAMATGALLLILLWLWVLLLAPAGWKARLLAAGVLLLPVLLAAALLEVRQVTGNLVPVLTWRWTPWTPPGLEVPRAPGTTTPRAAVEIAAPSPADYPQFLGPGRDGVIRGLRLARDWEARPPRPLWKRPIGAGWSAFAVAGGSALTHEQRGDFEMVVCYELATGRELWAHADRARYYEVIAGEGPRATPTVAEGRVFALGATGILNALDGATGARLWTRHILEENSAKPNTWGVSSSPLVLDGRVIVPAGGKKGRSLVAYAAATGELLWHAGNQGASYSSPLAAELAGRRQVVIFNDRDVAGHDPESGAVLWSYPWSGENPNVSQPLPVGGDRLLVSSGYGVGAELLEARAGAEGGIEVASLWKSLHLKAKFTNIVARDGFAYGLDDGIFTCIALEDGKRRWKAGRYGHGQTLLAGDLLLVQAESGEVVLLEATPEAHRELARFPALEGKTWNHPALAGRLLLVRNSREAACYELAVE
jgi:outer membrane protein assembly factor BamB